MCGGAVALCQITLTTCYYYYYYYYFVVVVILLQNKKKLITYVIASGLMYGEGENILRHVFNVRS